MAFPTSDSGYFTITALSFSPSVIAIGESVSFSITLKNTSGKSVTSCYITMSGTYPSTNASNGTGYVSDVYLHGGPSFAMSSISWGSNVSKTFTGTFPFLPGYYAVTGSNYLFPVSAAKLHLSIVTNATFANSTNYENFGNLRGTDGEYLAILSRRDNPYSELWYDAAIRVYARQTHRRIHLSEDEQAEIGRKLRALAEGEAPEAAFVYFVPDARKEGGEYVSCTARVKRIDMPARRVILTDGREIPIDDILEIDCPALRGAEASL